MTRKKKATVKKAVRRPRPNAKPKTARYGGVSAPTRRGSTAKRHKILKKKRNSDTETYQAIKEYEAFHWGIPYNRVRKRQIKIGKALVWLANVTAIEYECQKGDEGLQTYRHDFESRPDLLSNAAGNVMLIHGGKMKVKPEGIIG